MKVALARFILISFALIVGFLAVKYGLANLSYLKVNTYLERWQKENVLTQDELDDAFKSSDMMLKLHGHHPHYLNMTAKLYEWKAFKFEDDDAIVRDSLEKALALYKKSSELRSHWPLTWIYMANIKSRFGEYDDDFYQYLANAINYGPYMDMINLQVAQLFLLHADEMPDFPNEVAFEQINRALSGVNVRAQLLDFADFIGQVEFVCTIGHVNNNEWVAEQSLCQ